MAAAAALPGPRQALIVALAAAALGALLFASWFARWPRFLPPVLPLLGLGALGATAIYRSGRAAFFLPALGRFRPDTLACVLLAVAYRAPALLHPWAWVNRDGAYGAFVTLHLLQGHEPAPPFTEGANYQGTLKSHLAALLSLLTGISDLSFLMVAASLLLHLVFLAATMSLARRLGGNVAAAASGLFLALGPKFLTVFSLNCVGQYIDVLALGGVALALSARLMAEPARPAEPGAHLVIGVLLGAAFWQQPVALCYILSAGLALALRRASWRWGGLPFLALGLVLGLLPVLLWNLQNEWGSGDILGRDSAEIRGQMDAVPHLVRRALTISFPILAGLSPGHPWLDVPGVRPFAIAVIPAGILAVVLLRGREMARGLRAFTPTPAMLSLLLSAFCLALFFSVAAGRVYWRPRYLLPLVAALAVHLGLAAAALWRRSPPSAVILVALAVAVNVAGTASRLLDSARDAAYYERLVRGIDEKGIRSGYADFSLAAPITMFTAERIVISSALGPTPAYESELHARRVEEQGPDAFLLRPEDDVAGFAALLQGLGVRFEFREVPVPVFYGLSRRVRLSELSGRPAGPAPEAAAGE